MNRRHESVNVVLGDGQIGSSIARIVENKLHLTKKHIDFSNERLMKFQLHECLDSIKINSVINTIAYTNVDKAESESSLCNMVNAKCVKILAQYCNERRIPLIHYSTDFVFDGSKKTPYTEIDECSPMNEYGKSKLLGDNYIKEFHDKYLIFRVSWVYSVFTENNFIKKIINHASKNKEINVVDDQIGGLSSSFDIANTTCCILQKLKMINNADSLWGLYNMSPRQFESRFEIAKTAIEIARKYSTLDLDDVIIKKCSTDNNLSVAKRPLNSRLDSSKLEKNFSIEMRDWRHSLDCGLRFLYKGNQC